MRAALRAVGANFPVGPAETMDDIIGTSTRDRRFQLQLVVGFAGFALALATLGIYGVISFSVAQRTSELGVRLALGARSGTLALMVVREGMAPVVGGAVVGLTAAVVLGRAVAAELYGVTPGDPWIIAGVAAVLLTVGLCACWLPARRAMKTNPLTALKFE
jgi:putative ABC transport system permease protein